MNISNIKFFPSFKLWWMQAIYIAIHSGFLAILYVFFVRNNIDFVYILLAEAFGYGITTIIILLKKKFSPQLDIRIGFFLTILALISLLLPILPLGILFIYSILKIVGAIIFFTPYNILFFAHTKSNAKLYKMTVYFFIGAITGIIAPLLAGYIFSIGNLFWFTAIALLMSVFALYLTIFISKEKYEYNKSDAIITIKGIRTITMIDGALHTATSILILLYLTTFIQNELDLGKVLSIIALISALLSLKIAKFSDKTHKRFSLIVPLSITMGMIMLFFLFVDGFIAVLFLIIGYKFVNTLFSPIRANIMLDAIKITPVAWISRELYLNIGRTITLLLLALIVFFGQLKMGFTLLALLYFIFPILLRTKKIYNR